MSDLISRQAAIEAIQTAYCTPCKERGDDHNEVRCRACEFDDAMSQIDSVPSAVCDDCIWTVCNYNKVDWDTPSAEAVKGEWIKKQVFNPELDKYVPFIECSVCGYEPYFGGSESKFNYCANCGARMKGGDDE